MSIDNAAGAIVGEANSYMDDSYLSLDLGEININTHIHKIKLTFDVGDLESLNNKIKSIYRLASDYRLSSGNFERKRVYQENLTKIDFIYKPRSDKAFMRKKAILVLYQPSTESMNRVDSILKGLSIYCNISVIEFAFDFYSPFTFPLYEFLMRYLFLKYQRSPSRRYRNTYYTNNLRKSTKGIRVYLRPKDSDFKKYIRLELELHRAKIKNLHLTFPLTADKLDIDFRNYFDFKRIDFDKLYRHEVKQCRKQIIKLNLNDREGAQKGSQLLRCHIESWVTSLVDEPLMRAVERLKSKDYGVANYSRFLKPMNELNMLVEGAAYKQRFGLL
jgi:hypothetical protein